MRKIKLKYSNKTKEVTFYTRSFSDEHKKYKELTEKELDNLCKTIQNRIIFKHLGTVLPYDFGFAYWSDF